MYFLKITFFYPHEHAHPGPKVAINHVVLAHLHPVLLLEASQASYRWS